MRLALVQLDIAWESPATNRARAERRIQEAAACGARLVVLPEMFATGFSMRPERIAEPPGGPTEEWLAGVASDLGIHVIAGLAVTEGPENQAVWAAPTGIAGRYTKLHPFSFAREHEHYRAGTAVTSWAIEGLRVTPFVCYDLRFPEPFRATADETDLYVVIANWPDRRRAHWQTLSRARAIENLAYVAAVNRVGEGDALRYAGDSAVYSPWGETLASAAEIETVLLAEVDAAAVAGARDAFPALRDRRR